MFLGNTTIAGRGKGDKKRHIVFVKKIREEKVDNKKRQAIMVLTYLITL